MTLMKIKPEDIRKFEKSDYYKYAVKLLGEAIDHRPLTKNEFTTVRDYLIVTAMYENGSRPGPLENAKLDRFKQAEFVESKNRWAIVVDEHKTTRHQGPAEIVMDQRLYSYTKLYVEILRPCFVASGEQHLFIKEDGHGFRKGTIGRRVGEAFKKAGVREDVTVTATKIRKLFSSNAAELSPTKKRTINSHMKHKESTADNNYVLKLNTQKASAAHQLMRQIINEKTDGQKPTTKPAPEEVSESDDDIPLSNVLGLPGMHAHAGLPGPKEHQQAKTQLSAADKVVIDSLFKDDMEAGRLLSRHQVRAKMRQDAHLRKYVVQKPHVRKIYDYIRYQTNHVRQISHMEDDIDEDGSKVLTLTSGSRRQWNNNSTQAIENFFAPFQDMPKRSEILQHFRENPVLCHIIEAEGDDRCYEKVKNMFRKRCAK